MTREKISLDSKQDSQRQESDDEYFEGSRKENFRKFSRKKQLLYKIERITPYMIFLLLVTTIFLIIGQVETNNA